MTKRRCINEGKSEKRKNHNDNISYNNIENDEDGQEEKFTQRTSLFVFFFLNLFLCLPIFRGPKRNNSTRSVHISWPMANSDSLAYIGIYLFFFSLFARLI